MNIGTNATTDIIDKHLIQQKGTHCSLAMTATTGHSLDETKHLFNTGQTKHIHTTTTITTTTKVGGWGEDRAIMILKDTHFWYATTSITFLNKLLFLINIF